MDKYEVRRLRLLSLRDTRFEGSNARLAEALLYPDKPGSHVAESYVSRMLSDKGAVGHKNIAEKMAALIEVALDLPSGYMDGKAELNAWPFQRIPLDRLNKLTENQLRGIEDTLIRAVDALLGDSTNEAKPSSISPGKMAG